MKSSQLQPSIFLVCPVYLSACALVRPITEKDCVLPCTRVWDCLSCLPYTCIVSIGLSVYRFGSLLSVLLGSVPSAAPPARHGFLPAILRVSRDVQCWIKAAVPCHCQAIMTMENIMDRIAREVEKPPEVVRQLNFYKPGDCTHYGQPIEANHTQACWDQCLQQSGGLEQRRAAVDLFNAENRFRKRGLAVTPVTFGIAYTEKFLNQVPAPPLPRRLPPLLLPSPQLTPPRLSSFAGCHRYPFVCSVWHCASASPSALLPLSHRSAYPAS